VLIAGGLGERLGYSDIKITLPVTIVQDDYMYIKFYARYIKAIEDRVARELNNPEFRVPFCIMTSDDTNDKTVAVLQHGNYFGLNQD
jgi:UDP-sugar pyrophosphorylase